MSIFKDTFRGYVRDQLKLREELISIGNPDKFNEHEGNTHRRHLPHDFTDRHDETVTLKPGTHHTYTLNKQCVIRMTSLVDYVEDVGLDIGRLGGQSFNALRGASLSQNFILQGGILSDYARSRDTQRLDKDGNPIIERRVRRVDQVRSSFPKPGLETNIAYGDFAIGADASEDGYGIVPMPGIIDASVRTKSAYGSLREGKINFEVHNQRQLEIMEMLYMRPGYMVLLEWGWCPYIASSNGIGPKGNIVNELRLVEDETDNDIYTNTITQNRVYNAINNLKESQDGNYDGMLGFVKNFGFQAREDGGYSCFTELTSMGEVIDSLKIPAVSIVNTTKDIEGSADGDGELIIQGGKRYTEGNVPIDMTSTEVDTPYGKNTVTSESGIKKFNVNRGKFDKAIATKIFPSFNGLLGLITVINNYTIHGLGTTNSDFINENISKVFSSVKTYDHNMKEDKNLTEMELSEAKKTSANFNKINSFDPGGYVGEYDKTQFFKNLLAYQASDFENLLLEKLQLKEDPTKLQNYIIPTRLIGFESATDDEDSKLVYLKQTYIRWDALSMLLNDYLIPKSENGEVPIKIVTDRVYDMGNNINNNEKTHKRLDPLLFCPITSYQTDNDNNLLDFSCDANVCILPLQFEQNLAEEASSTADPMKIAKVLGYTPDTSIFPMDLIAGMYGYGEKNITKDIKYDGKSIFEYSQGEYYKKLNDTDKLRRIGSIFLNIPMLLNIAEKNEDNKNYSIGKFIKDIWDEVNKVCPNHNFVLTDDKESNNIFIIDLPVDNSNVPMDFHVFEPFSNKNILRSFDYTSNVPSAMTSTIAIQAQDPRSIQDIDGVTFAAFNRSIKNRILSKDAESTYGKTLDDIKDAASKLNSQQTTLLSQLETYRKTFFLNIKQTDNDKDTIGGGNIMGVLQTYQKNAAYMATTKRGANTFNSVIPLEFSATLDGISGMVIGNIFKVQKDRLPKAYHKSNIGFILFNEEQKITAGGDWTTDISGKMTILPDENVIIKGTLVTLPGADENEAVIEDTTQGAFTQGTTTRNISDAQAFAGNISSASLDSPLYLKYIKDNSLEKIGGNPIDSSKSYGYTTLRGTADNGGPGVNNESLGYNILITEDDNAYGMFDSYNDKGMYLGTVKAASGDIRSSDNYNINSGRYSEKYDENIVRLLNEFATEQYLAGPIGDIDPSVGITFEYSRISTQEVRGDEDPNSYYIPTTSVINENTAASSNVSERFNQDTMKKGVLISHCTDTAATWFSVEFDEGVDDKFLKGWVYKGSSIGINDADLASDITTTLSAFTKGENNVWMRSDTVAFTKESAVKMADPANQQTQ